MTIATRTQRFGALMVAALAVAVLVTAPALAESGAPASSPAPTQVQKIPVLNGHVFLTTASLPEPFLRTNFRNNLGVGVSEAYTTSALVVGDSTIATFGGDLYYASLGFKYQQAIKPWLAMDLKSDIKGRLGTGLKAALIDGMRASITGGAGVLVRVYETKKSYLSSYVGVTNASTTRMDPIGFVNGVIEDGGVTETNRLITETPTLQATADLRGAYGWSRNVGVMGFAGLSIGDSYDNEERTETYGALGLGVDFCLSDWLHAPLSLMLGYTMQNYPDVGEESKQAIQTGVVQLGYLSPGGFVLSMDLTNQWVSRESTNDTIYVIWPLLTMKYYF